MVRTLRFSLVVLLVLAFAAPAAAVEPPGGSPLADVAFPVNSQNWSADPGGFKSAAIDAAATLTGRTCGTKEFHAWSVGSLEAAIAVSHRIDDAFAAAGWRLSLISRGDEASAIHMASRGEDRLILSWLPEGPVMGLLLCAVAINVGELAPGALARDVDGYVIPPLPRPAPRGPELAPLDAAATALDAQTAAALDPAPAAAAAAELAAAETPAVAPAELSPVIPDPMALQAAPAPTVALTAPAAPVGRDVATISPNPAPPLPNSAVPSPTPAAPTDGTAVEPLPFAETAAAEAVAPSAVLPDVPLRGAVDVIETAALAPAAEPLPRTDAAPIPLAEAEPQTVLSPPTATASPEPPAQAPVGPVQLAQLVAPLAVPALDAPPARESDAAQVLMERDNPTLALWPYILAAILIGAGAYLIRALQGARRAAWPTALADIVDTGIEEIEPAPERPAAYRPLLRYRYSVNERVYEAIASGAPSRRRSGRDAAETVIAHFPDHARVEIAYDPSDPQKSRVVTRHPDIDPVVIGASACMLLAAAVLVHTLL